MFNFKYKKALVIFTAMTMAFSLILCSGCGRTQKNNDMSITAEKSVDEASSKRKDNSDISSTEKSAKAESKDDSKEKPVIDENEKSKPEKEKPKLNEKTKPKAKSSVTVPAANDSNKDHGNEEGDPPVYDDDYPDDGYYYTLLSLEDDGFGTHISSFEFTDNELMINASMYKTEDDRYEEGVLCPMDTYYFLLSSDCTYWFIGGDDNPQSVSRDEFMEVMGYFNGLGLIITVENGMVTEMAISS